MMNTERPVTSFEQRVYDMLTRIPAGHVITYAGLAQMLDCHSPQAVGQALKRNPFAPKIPCHRVIRSDLTIGGYAGETGGAKLSVKLKLLRDEGVEFDSDGKLRNPEALYTP